MQAQRTLIIATIFISGLSVCTAQQTDTTRFFVGLAPSLLHSMPSNASLGISPNDHPIHPHVGIGLEVDYGPIFSLLDLQASVSFLIAYGQVQTGKIGDVQIQKTIRYVPMCFGLRLASTGRLRPFVRLLAGVTRTEIETTKAPKLRAEPLLSEWEPCTVVGAGLEMIVTKELYISAGVDQWIMFSEVKGYKYTALANRHGGFNYSIRFSYCVESFE